ncbi:MAG: 50S ribosomal protein L21 [Waddliaceae bacterium]|jgi:large subunit ribosomal protein L21|nr:50S ribosomal protein L21 [Waddliaceae bacterium]MBT3578959.1 50S ribosomal protein L21 [Waddliaceae bacterium]MBT4445482.1 50S ribosomal protein L21 [Waddliaceae bacterium]MBT6928973.1 50S ribosomal protein L21 [Waddliaceae bacterium]MBT7264531.1 50S ribosomal protein L21 [Waddliaceae bacterium]
MYVIIKTGGKQYRVKKDDVIDVDLLGVEEGDKVEFSDILFVNENGTVKIGVPVVEGYSVVGEVLGNIKGPKVVAFKYKRRQNYRRKVGHRQNYSRIKITDIVSA